MTALGPYHKWSKAQLRRLPTETAAAFRTRKTQMEAIYDGFRWGRYEGATAEEMEHKLLTLREGAGTADPDNRPETEPQDLSEIAAPRPPIRHQQLLYYAYELTRVLRYYADEQFSSYDLSHNERWALELLYREDRITQTSLANRLHMKKLATGRLLDRLETKGWIERYDDPEYNRARKVCLGREGLARFQALRSQGELILDKLFAELTDAEEQSAATTLENLCLSAISHGYDRLGEP